MWLDVPRQSQTFLSSLCSNQNLLLRSAFGYFQSSFSMFYFSQVKEAELYLWPSSDASLFEVNHWASSPSSNSSLSTQDFYSVIKDNLKLLKHFKSTHIDELNVSCSEVDILSGSEDALVSPSVALAAVVSSSQNDWQETSRGSEWQLICCRDVETSPAAESNPNRTFIIFTILNLL